MLNDLFNLHLFVSVAKYRSFSEAAKRFQLSPASVSQRIARLEAELEVRLFQRTTRSVQLTEEGRVFLEQAGQGLSILERGIDLLKSSRHEAEGPIRITCCPLFGRYVLVPLIARFLSVHPQMRIELSYDDPDADIVESGHDVAIRQRQSNCQNFVSRRVYRTELILVAGAKYLAHKGNPLAPEDLSGHDWIRLAGSGMTWSPHIDLVRIDGAPGSHPVRVERTSFPFSISPGMDCVEAGLHNLGIIVLSPRTAAPMLRRGALVRILPDYRLQHGAEFFIEYPHRDLLPYRTRAFVDFLVDLHRRSSDLTIDETNSATGAVAASNTAGAT